MEETSFVCLSCRLQFFSGQNGQGAKYLAAETS